MQQPKIMVMGVGNVLLSDEGLGVQFVDLLSQEELPDNVELLEGGTAGLELVHLINEVDYLIIIDAVNAKDEPGAIFRFEPEDIRVMPSQFEVSFHQVGILEVLAMANILGTAPKTLIFGVQPKSLEMGMELSPEIQEVYPRIKDFVLKEIQSINELGEFRQLEA